MHKERTGLEVTRRATLVLGAGAALFLNLACPYTVLVLHFCKRRPDFGLPRGRRDDGLPAAGRLSQPPVKDRVQSELAWR